MTRRRVRWTRSARRDLEAIVAYLADRSPRLRSRHSIGSRARAKSLTTLADRGRVVPELRRLHIRQYRELLVPPYRVIYRASGALVWVLVLVDARRNLEDVLLDRLIRVEGQEQ
jgi:plasmid stabilization system protein ParE